jgi:hypothetical protein
MIARTPAGEAWLSCCILLIDAIDPLMLQGQWRELSIDAITMQQQM